jgi:rare lipoprotein A
MYKKKMPHASYYADKFHGREQLSGALFDMNKYTAAHKTL